MPNRRLWFRVLIPLVVVAVVVVWLVLGGGEPPVAGHGDNQPASASSESGRSPLGEENVTQRFAPGDCADQCPEVKVNTLRFDNAPELTDTLRRRLLGMAQLGDDKPARAPSGFRAYADQLFAESRAMRQQNPEVAPYSAQFDAKAVSRHDGLLILRLDTYTFLGGAHGMPVTRYMVIDKNDRHVLSLDDMLEPGAHKAFERRLRAAHTRWAKQQSLDSGHWPFAPSDNAAPLPDGMAVTYQAYDIAPYAVGQPTLHIPYDQLRDILKPRFLPGR